MNREAEKDMAQDVEENSELYQALADGDENTYKLMEVDKSGVDEHFWWSEWGRLNSLKEDTGAMLITMWMGIILASISTLYIDPNYSLFIVYLFIVSNTIVWWTNTKSQEKWCSEHSGDWE